MFYNDVGCPKDRNLTVLSPRFSETHLLIPFCKSIYSEMSWSTTVRREGISCCTYKINDSLFKNNDPKITFVDIVYAHLHLQYSLYFDTKKCNNMQACILIACLIVPWKFSSFLLNAFGVFKKCSALISHIISFGVLCHHTKN